MGNVLETVDFKGHWGAGDHPSHHWERGRNSPRTGHQSIHNICTQTHIHTKEQFRVPKQIDALGGHWSKTHTGTGRTHELHKGKGQT